MCRGGVTCSSGGLAKTCVVVFLLSAVGKLDASLLVTNGTHIIDYDISTNQQTVLPVSEPGGIVALAVDVGGQRLYYTNAETGGIVRCGLDGSNQHAVVNTDVTQPTGIAYDWVSGLVYWTDEGRGTVEVAQGDGSNRKTLISGQLFPRGIAVDPISGYLFWGNQGDFTIMRARLDGSDVETLHNTGLVWPNELVVDFPNSRLYWIEGYFGYIGSSALDGTDRTIVANVSSGYVLFGLALQDDTLYYTSWEGKLFSVDQNSGEQSEIVMEGQGEQLLGLVSVHPGRQPAGSNQCQSDNGDCSHLCLPTGPDSRICTCPDDGGLAIGKDNKTCAEPGQFLLYAKADEGQIMMLTMDLSMVARPVLLDQGVRPVAVAYDPIEQRVYWSDVVTHTINRVFLNGTGSEVFMDSTNGIASVEGLAVDWQNRRLYFSNLGLHYTGVSWGRVEMVGLDRTGHRRLLEGRVEKPRSIVLDMQARHMYITDWGEEPKILRADLDGRDPQTIVSSEMENPNGLAISEGKLYWVDSHVKSGENSTGTLEQAGLDGSNRAVLMQDVPFHIPFGLAVQYSTMYWTAWGQDGTGAVFQGNSGTGDHRVVVGGLGDPMAVTICNKSYTTPEEPSPCAGHDCSHICVPTAGSYRCMCPNTGEPQQFLLIADLTEIRMVPLDTPDRYPYPIIQVHDLYSNIAAVTYDPETKTVYFSDVGCRSILRAFLNGTGLEVVHRDTGVSDGMTIDPVDRYLYWTDGERGTIERIALDGDEETHEVLLQGLDRPRAIVVISDTNYMYWTDWGETPAVMRASMEVNATDVQNLVEGGLSWPNGLVVDNEGKLYIGDGNNTKIEAALLDGSDRHLVLDESSGHVYGLAKVGDALLWSDWAGQSIKMMTLGSDEIQVLVDGLMRPSELHVYPPSNVTVPNIPLTTEHMTTILQTTTITVTTQGPPTTTKEPITTTQEPTTTTEPTTAPEPTTTTEPTTPEPTTTTVPTTTQEPTTTTEPTTTPEPTTTTEPTTTQGPTTTTVPTTTPEPTTTTEPTTTPEPTTTTVPTTTPEPTTTTDPTTPEPTTTTEPTTTPEPTTTTVPTTTPEPTTTTEPTTTPEPTTTTVPTTTPEPTTTTEPTTTPEPTTTTEPTTTQEPTTTTVPTTTPEPTTTTEPTTTPEPTTTTEPTTTPEPTTTTEPTTTQEPTTTTEPTTTPEPTTTTEPTTTPEPTTTTEPTTTQDPTTTLDGTTTQDPTTITQESTTITKPATSPEPTTTPQPSTASPAPTCNDPTKKTPCFATCQSHQHADFTLESDKSYVEVDFRHYASALGGTPDVKIMLQKSSQIAKYPVANLTASVDAHKSYYEDHTDFNLQAKLTLGDDECQIQLRLRDDTAPSVTESCPTEPILLDEDDCTNINTSTYYDKSWFTDNVGMPDTCDSTSTNFNLTGGANRTVTWKQCPDISRLRSRDPRDTCAVVFKCREKGCEFPTEAESPVCGILVCGNSTDDGRQMCTSYCKKKCRRGKDYYYNSNAFDFTFKEKQHTFTCQHGLWTPFDFFSQHYESFQGSYCTDSDAADCVGRYKFTTPCKSDTKQKLLEDIWNAHQGSIQKLCKMIGVNCDVKIHCGQFTHRGRREAEVSMLMANVTFTSVSLNDYNPETMQTFAIANASMYTAMNALQQLVESGDLSLRINGTDYTVDPTSFTADFSNWGCPDGYIFYAGACYPCSEGSYYIGIDSECPSCPEGTYQDELGQMTCKPCPPGMSINGTGATSNATCKVVPEPEEATFDGHHVVFLAVGFICCITTVALVVVAVTRHCKKRQSKVTKVKPFVHKNDLQQVIGNDGHGFPLKPKDKATSDWVIIPAILPKGNKISPMHLSAWDPCCTDPKASMDPGRVLLPRTPIPPNQLVVCDKGTRPPQVPNIVESDC
ncbi:uncharacterized protein LOC144920665 [Branchiostoma floridae x Branchiostoma belcheri]